MQVRHAACTSLLVLAAAAPAQAAASCRIPGGRTVATSVVAKLIAAPTPDGAALFACIRRSGRKLALDIGYRHARLAGRWAAWERPGRPGRRRIAVHDLRTGDERLVQGHVAGRALVLTRRGSIAWVQRFEEAPQTPLYANSVARGGRLLDAASVDPGSLRLRRRTVLWESGDTTRSAQIP